jgi:hypothetical protein
VKRDWWKVLGRLPIVLHCGTQAVLQQLKEDEVQMGGKAGERLQAPVQLYHIQGTILSQYCICNVYQVLRIRIRRIRIFLGIPDSDSGSICQRYGSGPGSGSFPFLIDVLSGMK